MKWEGLHLSSWSLVMGMSGFVMWDTGFFGVPHPLCLGRVWLGPHCRSQGCRQHFQGWLGKQSEAFLTHRSANWGFRDEERLDLPGSEGRDVLCTAHSCGGIVAPGGSSAALGLRGALGTPSLPQSSSTFRIPTSASANPGQGSSSLCCCQGNQGGESEPGLICSTGLLIKKPACPPLPTLRAPPPALLLPKFPLIRARGAWFSVGDPQDPWSQPWGGTRAAAADGRGGISSPRFALGWICAAAALWGGRAWFRPHFPAPDGVHRL